MAIAWLEPWYSAEGDGQVLEEQLARECGPQHRLYGVTAKLIARRADQDEALFALEDGRIADEGLGAVNL